MARVVPFFAWAGRNYLTFAERCGIMGGLEEREMCEISGVADICVGVGRVADVRVKFAREEIAGRVERVEFECEGLGVDGEFQRFGNNDWRFCVPRERCKKAFDGDYRISVWVAEGTDKIVIMRGEGKMRVVKQ